MRVLILGASGFLGRPVQSLLAAQSDLRVMTGPRSRDTDLARCSAGVWRDLLDAAQPDAVVNCTGRIQGSPEELQQANIELVRRLVEAVARRTPPPRVLHLGSAAEYGAQVGAVDEDTPPHPTSPYGQSKLAGTRLLLEAAAQVPVHVLRVGNPVGAGQSVHTLLGRAAEQFRQALERPTAQVDFGDLGAARDFIDARDVARAVLTVLRCERAEPLLNVGRGEAVSARALVSDLARISGYAGQIHERADGSSRSATVPSQHSDIRRLQRLGWDPAYSLTDALYALWHDPDRQSTGHQAVA